jgi:hypothetical protein
MKETTKVGKMNKIRAPPPSDLLKRDLELCKFVLYSHGGANPLL